MKQRLQPLLDAYNRLAPRERRLLLIAGAVMLVALLYLLVWEPIHLGREAAQRQLADARSVAQQLERAAVQFAGRPTAAPVDRSRSLLSVVDQASRSATLGKAPSRIQPDGDDVVRVWIEDVPAEALLRWMAELEARHGLQIGSADIERREGGRANARLQLARRA